MRLLANSTVLGYSPLDVFDVDDNDAAAMTLVRPYLAGGHLVEVPVVVDPDESREPEPQAGPEFRGALPAVPTDEEIAAAPRADLVEWLDAASIPAPSKAKVGELRDQVTAARDAEE